jgi:hypothetical protein
MAITQGDKIKTDAGSSVIMVLNGDFKNTIKIKESSEVVFESINPVRMYMPFGQILSK